MMNVENIKDNSKKYSLADLRREAVKIFKHELKELNRKPLSINEARGAEELATFLTTKHTLKELKII